MNSFPKTGLDSAHNDGIDERHEQKTLQNFKKLLRDLVTLFQEASQVETVYIYWVNRARHQFVLETKTTIYSKASFQDRVSFEQHFLNDFKNLKKPVTLTIGKQVKPEALKHYPDQTPVTYITLLPVIKNGETIALTAVESLKSEQITGQETVIQTFRKH